MDSCRAWHEADVFRSLAQLHKGARGVVSAVAGSGSVRRLMELGFVPGETIEVIEEVRPGGDPIAVRIGRSIFALRRREAQDVTVKLEPAPAPAR
jgi:Fe2+ transport system protein FeoA